MILTCGFSLNRSLFVPTFSIKPWEVKTVTIALQSLTNSIKIYGAWVSDGLICLSPTPVPALPLGAEQSTILAFHR
ncbi:MAG: hypothetical protein ACO31I_14545 [Prochlorotrichaceae cyanobacterium]